ncbi:MAG: M23 family metallopeptidase, partial [Verrucomicrobiaceae bacterium]
MKLRAVLLTVALLVCGYSATQALDITLPTANDALFREKPEEFYMYVNRYTDGVKTMPWEGGQYGFVRDMRKTPDGQIFYTRFHSGIDIKPLQRDAKGNPLDTVHAIAAGRVVHTSPDRRASNFGCYLVVEHQWDGCPYYSLYA